MIGEYSHFMKKNKNHIRWGLTAFLVILASLISYYIMFHLDNFKGILKNLVIILMPVIDGLVIAYLLTPLLNTFERKIIKPFFNLIPFHVKDKQQRMCSIIFTMLIVFIIFYGFFSMVIPQITTSIMTIVEQFPSYVDTLTSWITKTLNDNPQFASYLTNIINESSFDLENFLNTKIIPQLNNVIMTVSLSVYSVFKELWNLVIGFIISIYLLGSKEKFAAQAKKIIYAFLPLETSNRFISNIRFANKTFGGFFVGKILDSIIIGCICFAVTNIMGTPFSVLISVIVGVTNIIPFFGPFLGAIPSTLLVLFVNPLQAVYFVIFVVILQQIDGNIIGPKILGSSTGLSSFWVIFSITLFGGLFGIFGMIIGVPIFAIIFAFIKSLVESRLMLKDLPPETSKYLRLLYINAEDMELVNFSEQDNKPFSQITQFHVKSQEKIKNKNYNSKKQETSQKDNNEN